LFTPDKFKIIVISSYRTPEIILKMAFNTFSEDHYVVKTIDKKAYLSALAISSYIVVTCDSTSMISEAAITGKPVYIAMMKSFKPTGRFKKFYSQLKDLGVTRELGERIESWSYNSLNEVSRIAPIIKRMMKKNGII
jgi:mitochondrial fission protein ELM1